MKNWPHSSRLYLWRRPRLGQSAYLNLLAAVTDLEMGTCPCHSMESSLWNFCQNYLGKIKQLSVTVCERIGYKPAASEKHQEKDAWKRSRHRENHSWWKKRNIVLIFSLAICCNCFVRRPKHDFSLRRLWVGFLFVATKSVLISTGAETHVI